MLMFVLSAALLFLCAAATPKPLPGVALSHRETRALLDTLPVTPALYKINKFHFTGPYSCIPGYNGSALFLSQASFARNSPEVLYYGSCPPQPAIWYGGTHGLMIDTGVRDLSSFSLNDAIYYSMNGGYVDHPTVVEKHTYVKLFADPTLVVGWMAITVDRIYPDGAMDARWGVFDYNLVEVTKESPGFEWGAHLK